MSEHGLHPVQPDGSVGFTYRSIAGQRFRRHLRSAWEGLVVRQTLTLLFHRYYAGGSAIRLRRGVDRPPPLRGPFGPDHRGPRTHPWHTVGICLVGVRRARRTALRALHRSFSNRDTMMDLVMDLVGAVAAGILSLVMLGKGRPSEVRL